MRGELKSLQGFGGELRRLFNKIQKLQRNSQNSSYDSDTLLEEAMRIIGALKGVEDKQFMATLYGRLLVCVGGAMVFENHSIEQVARRGLKEFIGRPAYLQAQSSTKGGVAAA